MNDTDYNKPLPANRDREIETAEDTLFLEVCADAEDVRFLKACAEVVNAPNLGGKNLSPKRVKVRRAKNKAARSARRRNKHPK